MDVQAHLLSQGWLGPGHALDARIQSSHAVHEATREKLLNYNHKGHRGLAFDPSSSTQVAAGNGLTKPLLVSQRKARFGIGKKAHEPPSGSEWWLKGFAAALDNVGKSESERSSGASTPVGVSGKHAGLYGYFVKGQMMQGTISGLNDSKKRKSDVLEEEDVLAVKPVSKSRTAAELVESLGYLAARDGERSKGHKSAKNSDLQQFEAAKEFFGAAAQSKSCRRPKQSETKSSGDDGEAAIETKEERNARRRRRKERQMEDGGPSVKSLAQMVEEELAKLEAEQSNDDQADKKARRAEKKKRKVVASANGASH